MNAPLTRMAMAMAAAAMATAGKNTPVVDLSREFPPSLLDLMFGLPSFAHTGYRHRSGGACGIRVLTGSCESIPRRVREVRMAAEAKRKRKNAKRKLDFERAAVGKGPWV